MTLQIFNLTDQNSRPIDLRGEYLTIRYQNMQNRLLPMLVGLAADDRKDRSPSSRHWRFEWFGKCGRIQSRRFWFILEAWWVRLHTETQWGGLYLKPSAARIVQGDGLYLKRGQQFYDGSGLILGPNSPFKNVPLLGMLLQIK